MDLRNYIAHEFAAVALAGVTLLGGATVGMIYGLEKAGFIGDESQADVTLQEPAVNKADSPCAAAEARNLDVITVPKTTSTPSM